MKTQIQFKLKNGKTLSINNNALRCDKQGIPFSNIVDDREYRGGITTGVDRSPVIPEPETDIDHHNRFTFMVEQHWPTRKEKEHNFFCNIS